jgi:hypothetical protein
MACPLDTAFAQTAYKAALVQDAVAENEASYPSVPRKYDYWTCNPIAPTAEDLARPVEHLQPAHAQKLAEARGIFQFSRDISLTGAATIKIFEGADSVDAAFVKVLLGLEEAGTCTGSPDLGTLRQFYDKYIGGELEAAPAGLEMLAHMRHIVRYGPRELTELLLRMGELRRQENEMIVAVEHLELQVLAHAYYLHNHSAAGADNHRLLDDVITDAIAEPLARRLLGQGAGEAPRAPGEAAGDVTNEFNQRLAGKDLRSPGVWSRELRAFIKAQPLALGLPAGGDPAEQVLAIEQQCMLVAAKYKALAAAAEEVRGKAQLLAHGRNVLGFRVAAERNGMVSFVMVGGRCAGAGLLRPAACCPLPQAQCAARPVAPVVQPPRPRHL